MQLTVDMYIKLLSSVGRNTIECLTDVDAHVLPVDVGDVQHGRGDVTCPLGRTVYHCPAIPPAPGNCGFRIA